MKTRKKNEKQPKTLDLENEFLDKLTDLANVYKDKISYKSMTYSFLTMGMLSEQNDDPSECIDPYRIFGKLMKKAYECIDIQQKNEEK